MSEKVKKRKRPAGNDESPRKKQATSKSSSNSVRIHHINDNPKLGPVLISSPGLVLQETLEFKPFSKPRKSTSTALASSYSRDELILHSISHPVIDYTAYEGTANIDEDVKHYVGIYDPDKGEVTVVPVRNMAVKRTLRAREDPKEKEEGSLKGQLSYQEQKENLLSEFGSKRGKQILEDQTINNPTKDIGPGFSEGNILAGFTDNKDEASGNVEELRLQEWLNKRPMPKPVLDAKKLPEVYPLSILIENMPSTLPGFSVQSWQTAVEGKEPVQVSHRFVANRIVRVVNSKKIERIQTLQYLLLLLQLHTSLRRGKGQYASLSLPPREQLTKALSAAPNAKIVDVIKRKYAPDGSQLSRSDEILLQTTILTLTLHIDEFTTDIRDIVQDLSSVDIPQIQQYYRQLGCKPYRPLESEFKNYNVTTKAQAAQLKVFKLRIPLEFPKQRFKGRSGARR